MDKNLKIENFFANLKDPEIKDLKQGAERDFYIHFRNGGYEFTNAKATFLEFVRLLLSFGNSEFNKAVSQYQYPVNFNTQVVYHTNLAKHIILNR